MIFCIRTFFFQAKQVLIILGIKMSKSACRFLNEDFYCTHLENAIPSRFSTLIFMPVCSPAGYLEFLNLGGE